jgi:hypothetical protein
MKEIFKDVHQKKSYIKKLFLTYIFLGKTVFGMSFFGASFSWNFPSDRKSEQNYDFSMSILIYFKGTFYIKKCKYEIWNTKAKNNKKLKQYFGLM